MPVKRRRDHRRIDPRALLEIWGGVFQSEYDFFDDLSDIGVATDDHSRPDRAVALDAWQRLGRLYIDECHTPGAPCWALAEFGEPENAC